MTKKQENRLSRELAREMLAEFDPTWKLAYISKEKNTQNFRELAQDGDKTTSIEVKK